MNEKEGYLTDSVNGIEVMSKERERALFEQIRSGNKEAKNILIQSCMATAREIADKYKSSEASARDLLFEAVATLDDAILEYDCCEHENFYTYATVRIEERMQRFYSNLPWLLPIDYRIVQLHDRYEMALFDLFWDYDDPESAALQEEEYVAEYLDISVGELRNMKNEYAMCRIEPLDIPVKLDKSIPDKRTNEYGMIYKNTTDDIDNTGPLIETIVDPATDNAAAEYLDDLLDCLTEDEKYIVCAKNGVLSVAERTDKQIASALGVDKDKVELLYLQAIDKIRKRG